MSTTAEDRRGDPGVEIVYEDDLVTARDRETDVAASGDTRSEALAMLAEALELHENDATEPVDDEDEVIRELGLDPGEVASARKRNDELPEFMR